MPLGFHSPRSGRRSRNGRLRPVPLRSMICAGAGFLLIGCSEPHEQEELPIPVRVEAAALVRLKPEETYTGAVRARWETEMGFRVGGKIAERLVEIGQTVRAGEVLARLDPTAYGQAVRAAEAALSTAEANLVQTRADLQRNEKLIAQGWATPQLLELRQSAAQQARGRVEQAKALLQIARDNLSYTELRAETDGVVLAIPTEVGQVVAPGQLVMRIVRPEEREVWVGIPENRMADLERSDATVTLWSDESTVYPAALRELSPAADPVTRTFLAKFSIQDAGPAVRIGMTATVRITHPADEAVRLPASALFQDKQKPAVWIVHRETRALRLTPVAVRDYGQDTVTLAEGVSPGDLVVTAGVHKLDPRTRIRIVEAWAR